MKDLRPRSSEGRRKQGGLMNLIFEKSSAGEEMRMIDFWCALLRGASAGAGQEYRSG